MALSLRTVSIENANFMRSIKGDTALVDKVTKYREQFNDRHKIGEDWRKQGGETTRNYFAITLAPYRLLFGENLHHAPVMPWDSYKSAATKHNYRMAVMMEAKPTDKIVDFGCGWGLSSRDIAEISYAHVTGINITKEQVDHCRRSARQLGMENLLRYVNEDFTNTSFPDNSFDKLYSMEAIPHCPNAEGVYGEAFRILKPGGLAVLHDCGLTDNYDEENPYHVELIRRLMYSGGVLKVRSTRENLAAIKNVGFEVLMEEDYSVVCQNRRKTVGTMLTEPRYIHVLMRVYIWLLWIGEKVGILKPGRYDAFNLLRIEIDSLVEILQIGIGTPIHMIVARKPDAK